MEISALAGKPAPRDMLVDLAQLEQQYYERRPDTEDPNQRPALHVSTLLFAASANAHLRYRS
jgi:phosphoglucomutase